MRFSSNKQPTLTPLGHRLLILSESKLANLEHFDDASTLLKGVLVRESVRSAWKTVDQGLVGEHNDWHNQAAMGLDVISEEEDDEEEDVAEESWFEDLVSSLGEEVAVEERHEWVETVVGCPVLDEVEYDVQGMEAYELSVRNETVVTVSAVYDLDEDSDWDTGYDTPPLPTSSSDPLTTPIIQPQSFPSTPASPACSEISDLSESDYFLPPPLYRSFSSSSGDEMECVTPPTMSCEDLEETAGEGGMGKVREEGMGFGLDFSVLRV